MVFKDLPAGTAFYFGNNRVYRSQYRNGRYETTILAQPLRWCKTNLDGLSIYMDDSLSAAFDHPRPATGANRYERAHGTRLFFLSSLYRYLNCADASWRNVADGDSAPMYSTRDELGFLSFFNDLEVKMLQPFAMKANVPAGYTKQHGAQMEKNVLVGIPSLEQLGVRNNSGAFGVDLARKNTWVTDADTMQKHIRYGNEHRLGGDRVCLIMPIIRIRDDAPVDTDENGHYIIHFIEPDFDGDIDALLGLAA